MTNFDKLWVEKYRPQTLDDMVLSPDIKETIRNIINDSSSPHILLTGKPGIGKTTLAKILVKVHDSQYQYYNMSDKGGIDTVRDDIVTFAQSKSIDGNEKKVICDEYDGSSIPSQKALRNVMEEYAKNTRFIITANNKNNIIPAIQSRCMTIDLKFEKTDVMKRLLHILNAEGIRVTKDEIVLICENIVKPNFPDIRKTINTLQKMCLSGRFIFDNKAINSFDICNNIFNLILKDNILDIRKFLIENEQSFNSDYNQLLKDFLYYIYDNKDIDKDKKLDIIITIRDSIYQSAFMADLEINAISCMFKIYKIINK